ncbi:unnamed protein product [Gongylonema pulchrum]|uniref:Uncharacterized protein n=1 Tax=Gongylonema pulchrum TaxID=637853 RepID=A0A183ED88_9BILA|nr:unnamed protein product [Gongylonema pulchrum]
MQRQAQQQLLVNPPTMFHLPEDYSSPCNICWTAPVDQKPIPIPNCSPGSLLTIHPSPAVINYRSNEEVNVPVPQWTTNHQQLLPPIQTLEQQQQQQQSPPNIIYERLDEYPS